MVLSPLAMLAPSPSPKPLLFYSIYHRQLIDGFVPLKSCLHDRYDDTVAVDVAVNPRVDCCH